MTLTLVLGLLTLANAVIIVALLAMTIAVQHRHGKQNWGSIEGHSEDPSDKVFDVFKSLGTVAFAFAFADRIPKIQNSIPQNDEVTVRQTKRALNIAIPLVTACYAIFGIMGCAALATSTLDIWGQLPMSAPHWVVNLLLILLFIQMLGIYQALTDSMLMYVEQHAKAKMSNTRLSLLHYELSMSLWGTTVLRCTPFGLLWRTGYISASTVVAILLWLIEDLAGIIGPVVLFSSTVFLPIKMHVQQAELPAWTWKWAGLQMIMFAALCTSIAAIIGSVVSLVDDTSDYRVFDNSFWYTTW